MKTVNLELSQKLKSNGYPQRGVDFYWMLPHEDALDEDALDEDALGKDYVFGQLKEYGTINLIDFCASPTADEILDIINSWNSAIIFRFTKTGSNWFLTPDSDMGIPHFKGLSVADCLAELYLWLVKQGLIK